MDVTCFLPYTVLTNIFKYLPLKDRKTVRLTCHLWNYACHHPAIIKNEKFVFHPGVTRNDTAVCISNCKNSRSDFEFFALDSMEIPFILWTNCGNQITSMYLNECAFSDDTLKNILIFCPNLISLRIIFLKLISDRTANNYDFINLFSALDYLISLGVKREHLIHFELFISTAMTGEEVEKLFRVLPKLRTFRHGFWSPNTSWDTLKYFRAEYERNTHNLPEELLRGRIENFTFNWWMYPGWLESFNSDLGVKFKNLEIALSSGEEDVLLPADLLMNFLSKQTELEKLGLYLPDAISGIDVDGIRFCTTLLHQILKKASKLKTLELRVDHYQIRFRIPEFLEFLNLISNLEALDVNWIHLHDSDSMELLLSPSPQFINLKILKLERADEQVILQILRRCVCLSTLHLVGTINNKILQTIFKFHTELKDLDLCCNLNKCTDAAGFTTGCRNPKNHDSAHSLPEGYSFARLQNLERLALVNIDPFYKSRKLKKTIFAAIHSEFDFPQLKHFVFSWILSKEQERQLLNMVSIMAPCLETLEMRPREDGLNLGLLIRYCRRLDQLKCVKFVSHTSTDLYEELFILCPSLIKLFTREEHRHLRTISEEKLWFYDRILRTLKSMDWGFES